MKTMSEKKVIETLLKEKVWKRKMKRLSNEILHS